MVHQLDDHLKSLAIHHEMAHHLMAHCEAPQQKELFPLPNLILHERQLQVLQVFQK